MKYHETKRVRTVGELRAALANYPDTMPLMDAEGEDIRVTRLSNRGGEAVEVISWRGEESPL